MINHPVFAFISDRHWNVLPDSLLYFTLLDWVHLRSSSYQTGRCLPLTFVEIFTKVKHKPYIKEFSETKLPYAHFRHGKTRMFDETRLKLVWESIKKH